MVPSDIEIARKAKKKLIVDIAKDLGLSEDDISLYGKYKAKVDLEVLDRLKDKKSGHLVLVSAMTPTPAGEGKTTTTVGLGQALNRIGKKTVIALREPSLGPCFGIKGGAAGGGYSQVVPMEDINLHFTGDLHAVGTAHNLLSAMLDAHIHKGNELNIDLRKVTWPRVVDMNDRALRNIVVGLGGASNGFPRETGFDITVASEVMACLCLATDIQDLKERFKRIIVGYTFDNKPVTAEDLKAAGAMTVLMKDALKPNLVQTLENTPAFIHGGPFANIAHGCNSVAATKMGVKLGDYMVTEAGFGFDLGGEKFLDIKCPYADLNPEVIVLVATIRALKLHGGLSLDEVKQNKENPAAVEKGLANLGRHISNASKYGVSIVVALNRFVADHDSELKVVKEYCESKGVEIALSEVWEKGGAGGEELAHKVVKAVEKGESNYAPLYDWDKTPKEKIEKIVTEIYGATGVKYTKAAEDMIAKIEGMGLGGFPICIAKTQDSISDNKDLKGDPHGKFELTVREVRISAGAGFIVALTGAVMTMPGLGKKPSAQGIDIDENGWVVGLF